MNLLKGTVAITAIAIVCQSQAIVLLQDDFSYADGSLVANSGGNWTTTSGTAGQVDVAGGVLNLTQAESEDVNRTFASQASGSLFAGVNVNFSGLPSGTGGYFMHFKDSTTSGFRGRVFATAGVGAGTYRIGITNASNTLTAIIATDLNLGMDYRVVFSTDAATQANSTVEVLGVGSASAADVVATPLVLSSFAFRQSLASGNGMGTLTADNLIVATTRAEAVPEPATMTALALGMAAILRRRKK